MKDLSPEMVEAINSSSVSLLTAVHIDISPTEQIYVHSGLGTFTIDGNEYLGVGDLGSIDNITSDDTTTPNGIALSISGLDTTLIQSVLEDGYQGRPVVIYLCTFNNDFELLYSHISYKGKLDTMNLQIGSTAIINVNVENDLVNWNRSNVFRWNTNTHIRQDPDNKDDKFFEFLSRNIDKELIFDPYIRRN